MSWYVKLSAVLAIVGLSAGVGASPTQTPTAEGQVLSVLAVEVPDTMTIGETGPEPAR